MKNIVFIILLILFSTNLKAQQIIIEGVAKIDLDSNFKKISAIQAIDHVTAKFKFKKSAEDKYRASKHIYRYNDILMQFFSSKKTYTDDDLQQLQHGLIALNPGDKDYSSEIRKIKQGDVLITKSLIIGTEHYNFLFINTKHSEVISGEFQFNPEDEAEAKALLERVLKSVKFTE